MSNGDGKGRQARGQLQGSPRAGGRQQEEQDDNLCEADADGRCKQMALWRALLLQKVFPSPGPEAESSQMLLLGLTAAMESPGGTRAGMSGSPASPPPGLEQDQGWEQLMSERLFVSWDHRKGTLVLEDTNFYCRVSTKASNSRTFFSCTASFSGSESKSSAMDCAPISMERLLS